MFKASCALVIGNQILRETDCEIRVLYIRMVKNNSLCVIVLGTNGRVDFLDLRNRFVEWTPKITIVARNNSITVYRSEERNFRIAIGMYCSNL